MQVVLRVGGCIHVYHQGDALDVNPPSRHIGRDQRRSQAVAEGFQGAGAYRLALATVQGLGGHPAGGQAIREPIRTGLGADEEDRPTWPGSDLLGHGLPIRRVDDEHVMVHRRHRCSWDVHLVPSRVAQVVADEGIDVAIKGGTEEQSLPTWLGQIQQLAHDRHEAHVRHLIGLVQDRDSHLVQLNGATLHQVHQPTRGGYQQVHPAFDRPDLRCVGHATGHQSDPQAAGLGQSGQVIDHLHREFARRHQDQSLRMIRNGRHPVESAQGCQTIGQGLPGAGTGAGQQVAAGDPVRQGGLLDRKRIGDPAPLEGAGEGRWESEIQEAHPGFGHGRVSRGAVIHESSNRGNVASIALDSSAQAILMIAGATQTVPSPYGRFGHRRNPRPARRRLLLTDHPGIQAGS